MWPEFIPIEYRGMSVITALFMIAIIIILVYLYGRIVSLRNCMDHTASTLNDIKVGMGRMEAYSETHYEDISRLQNMMEKRWSP